MELARSEHVAVQDKVAGMRRFGAAALDLAWVAAGRLDAYWERNLSPWDMAAGIALVREAGGFTTDLDGRDDMLKTGGILAGNADIHRELLQVLKQARRIAPSAVRAGLRRGPFSAKRNPVRGSVEAVNDTGKQRSFFLPAPSVPYCAANRALIPSPWRKTSTHSKLSSPRIFLVGWWCS